MNPLRNPLIDNHGVSNVGVTYINPYRFGGGGGGSNGLLTNLVSVWELDEASGNALDAHGSNDLTDNNTVAASATAPSNLSGSRDFELSNSEDFSLASGSDSDLRTGDIDFTWSVWVNAEAFGSENDIISKYETTGNNRQYRIHYASIGSRIKWTVSNDGFNATSLNADNLGSPSTSTWYHIVAWHDSVNNELGIAVNNGTANTVSYSSGVYSTASIFRIGALGRSSPTFYWDGLITQAAFWKNRVLDSDDIAALYNSGAGLPYSSWTS